MSSVLGFVEWRAGNLRMIAAAFASQNDQNVEAQRSKRDAAIRAWLATSTWWQRQWYTCGSLGKNASMDEIERAAWDCNISGLMNLLGIRWRITSDDTGDTWLWVTRNMQDQDVVLVNANDSGKLTNFAATRS